MTIPILVSTQFADKVHSIADKWNFPVRAVEEHERFFLKVEDNQLKLYLTNEPKLEGVCVDFLSNKHKHRLRFGGGRSQAIARAVGLKKNLNPSVIDATAGLGKDAFVLASLGCRVHMIEQHPVIAALLEDGLHRLQQNPGDLEKVSQNLSLAFGDSRKKLTEAPFVPEAVYLDPMFPPKTKSAMVKKEMRIFKELFGSDKDCPGLLASARQIATNRVVVKRPAYAGWLEEQKPNGEVKTPKNRFDLYFQLNQEEFHGKTE